MKRLILQTLLLICLALATFVGIMALAGGSTDAYYRKFASPPQHNLILGTSRASQGVKPAVLDSLLGHDFFNYAFTAEQSPYGPVYFNSVRRKLDPATEGGIFILTVDPWSISSTAADPNDSLRFREVGLHLDNVEDVTSYPNWQYLWRYLSGGYYRILLNPLISSVYLHRDGWLEVSVSMKASDVRERTQSKLASYRQIQSTYRFSARRLASLTQLIRWLNQHGRVYLVRLPVPSAMAALESEMMPDFDEKIQEVTTLTAGYLDLTTVGETFTYTDGNHLYKGSARQASEQIAEWIKSTGNP